MAENKNQHFIPRHYLREFACDKDRKNISCVRIEPYKFIESAKISRQCQEDNFYDNDEGIDNFLKEVEKLAFICRKVANGQEIDLEEFEALKYIAIILKMRSRKAIEEGKLLSKRIFYEVIENALEAGELPPAPPSWNRDAIKVGGVCSTHIKASSDYAYLEMSTLDHKILLANDERQFITSDNPIVTINQLFPPKNGRSFTGFSRSGFQLLFPISPRIQLFFYDPKVYKVGNRREKRVKLSNSDIEVVNSLQFQSADKCLYFSEQSMEKSVRQTVSRNLKFRQKIEDALQEHKLEDGTTTILHQATSRIQLPNQWTFCKLKRHPKIGEDRRRDAIWTNFIRQAEEAAKKRPDLDIFEVMLELLRDEIPP